MRKWLTIACALVAVLIAGSAAAQETRGTISGTVRDKDGVLPGANVTITNTGTNVSQQLVTNGSGYFEAPLLIAGAYEVSVEIAELQELPADRHSARGRPVGSAHHHPGRRQRERTRGRGRGGRAPRHQCGFVGAHLREPSAYGAADVLEHADAPDPQRLGRGGERGSTVCDPGLRRRPIVAGRPDRRRRRHGVHHRWRHECRQRPQHSHVAQFRHVAGDANRNVELRCVGGTRHRARRGDDDQGGHQPMERPGRLPGVDEPPERREPLSEADSRRAIPS